jgi:hypothetical protein
LELNFHLANVTVLEQIPMPQEQPTKKTQKVQKQVQINIFTSLLPVKKIAK